MQQITVLGSTGSIGESTLDVVARHSDEFRIFALTARNQVARLAEQCARFQPRYAVLLDQARADELRQHLKASAPNTEILVGEAALCEVCRAAEVTTVMAAIVGAAGLSPTLAAAQAGKRLLLANKEALVVSGALLLDAVAASGAELLPVDSEHNAIFQVLPPNFVRQLAAHGIRKLLLTASGGPFRQAPLESLVHVSPEQAVAHPNWVMGRKISVDSATMMNKGLEVIEAHWLFGAAASDIEVVIHPQSVIHSMVQYADGSVLAQLGQPDMRTPIANALAYPRRMDAGVAPLSFAQLGALTFEPPDEQRFPCLKLAFDALAIGGTAAATLNAANEVAVEAFLNRQIRFTDIASLVAEVMNRSHHETPESLEHLLQVDAQARQLANTVMPSLSRPMITTMAG